MYVRGTHRKTPRPQATWRGVQVASESERDPARLLGSRSQDSARGEAERWPGHAEARLEETLRALWLLHN
jgi:hypothetical protein